MEINKKFLQLFGVILIIIFHYWARFTNSVFERFIVSVSYIGVDLFFICSAYSLSRKKHIEYKEFVLNRFKNIYLKFVIFAAVYSFFIYKPSLANSAPFWIIRLSQFVNIITGYELFIKGGGAFLWFVPAIMIFYLIFPLFINWELRYKEYVALAFYVLLAVTFKVIGYREIFIFLNRIPLVLITYIIVSKGIKLDLRHGLLLTAIGIILMYLFSFKMRLNKPVYDMYYLMAVPLVLGIAVLTKDFKISLPATMIGNASLEIYAIQMMYGAKIIKNYLKITKQAYMVNFMMFVTLMAAGVILNQIFNLILNRK